MNILVKTSGQFDGNIKYQDAIETMSNEHEIHFQNQESIHANDNKKLEHKTDTLEDLHDLYAGGLTMN